MAVGFVVLVLSVEMIITFLSCACFAFLVELEVLSIHRSRSHWEGTTGQPLGESVHEDALTVQVLVTAT